MQAEETVEIDRSVRSAAARLRNRNRRTQVIVIRLRERNHNVQPVHRAALKQHDHLFLVRQKAWPQLRAAETTATTPCRASRSRRFSRNIAEKLSL